MRNVAIGATIAALLLALYLLEYALLLTPSKQVIEPTEAGDTAVVWYETAYRSNRPVVRSLLAPANWLDRRLRPHFWGGPVFFEEVKVPGPQSATEAFGAQPADDALP